MQRLRAKETALLEPDQEIDWPILLADIGVWQLLYISTWYMLSDKWSLLF